MKKIVLFYFFFQFSIAQTIEDRNKIKQSYNKVKVASSQLSCKPIRATKERLKHTNKLINESETKSLQKIYDGLPIFYSVDNDQL
jgi:hypothetical protein